MARRYGRAPRGERVIGSVPHGHWMTSTFIAGLRHDGIIVPCLFNCAIDGELFLAHVEQQLAPALASDDIVIADNLGSHKVAGVRQAIEARGASLHFLPSYSPDLNPICQRAPNFGSPAHVVLFGVVHRAPIGETPWSRSCSRWSCLCLHVGWLLFPVPSWCNGSGRDLTTSQLRPSREVPRPRVPTVARSRVAFIAIGSVFCAIFPGKVARS